MGHRIMGSCHASKETKDPTDPNSRVPGTNLLPSCSIRSSLDPNKPGSTAHPEKANEDLSTPHTEAITPSSKAVPPSSPARQRTNCCAQRPEHQQGAAPDEDHFRRYRP